MRKLNFFSVIIILIFFYVHFNSVDVDSHEIGVNVRVVDIGKGNVSVITGGVTRPLEKINARLMSLTSGFEDYKKVVISFIVVLVILVVYILIRIKNKRNLRKRMRQFIY